MNVSDVSAQMPVAAPTDVSHFHKCNWVAVAPQRKHHIIPAILIQRFKVLHSTMLLQMHLRSEPLSNGSAASGQFWAQNDFSFCVDYKEARSIWAFCLILCFAFGFPASIAIFWDMFKTHQRGTLLTPNNFFILNLSVMDAVFLAYIPLGLINHFVFQRWVIEAIWNGLYSLNVCGRPFMMACICLDCYLAVVHPITYHKKRSLTPRVIMAGFVWIWTVATGIAYGLFYKLYLTELNTVPFAIAIVIIGGCDSFILHALVKSDPGRQDIHPQKKRAIQTLINSLVMAVFSYLPPVILLTVTRHLIDNVQLLICVIVVPISLTSSLGSAVMPILHLKNKGKLICFRLGCFRKP